MFRFLLCLIYSFIWLATDIFKLTEETLRTFNVCFSLILPFLLSLFQYIFFVFISFALFDILCLFYF